jgi:alpha-L-fucosidase 2
MLLQSHTGVIRIFPAIPEDWEDAGFENLRARGAFLVSASLEGEKVIECEIHSEKGGTVRMRDPFAGREFECSAAFESEGDLLVIRTDPRETIRFRAGE